MTLNILADNLPRAIAEAQHVNRARPSGTGSRLAELDIDEPTVRLAGDAKAAIEAGSRPLLLAACNTLLKEADHLGRGVGPRSVGV